MAPGPESRVTSGTDDSFAWDNERYEALVEQRTGATIGLLDRLICLGLLMFGISSLIGTVAMAYMHLSH